jgi:hypothetical protein
MFSSGFPGSFLLLGDPVLFNNRGRAIKVACKSGYILTSSREMQGRIFSPSVLYPGSLEVRVFEST